MEQTNASPREKTAQSAEETSVKKAYSCTFCKKGFSNAQALGGHMNIHRRDRAKLVMQSLDDDSHDVIIVPNKNSHPVDDDHRHQSSESGHQEEITSSPKRPCMTLSREEDGDLEQSKLSNIYGEEKLGSSPRMLIEAKEIDELNHGCSFPLELDLELRLGHERPQQQSTVRAEEKLS